MRAVIILKNIKRINKEFINNSFIVGADLGAYNAIRNGITPDVAIGDFDSVTEEEFEIIKTHSKKMIILNPIKDKTDTLEALELVKDYDEIIILGGISGKRIEHFYANLLLLYQYKNLKIMDDNSLIEVKSRSFSPNINYKFVSIFSLDDNTNIDLIGFKYNLTNYDLKIDNPLGVSNEIIEDPFVKINRGKILIIYTKDDKES